MQIIIERYPSLETALHETLVCLLPEERHGVGADYGQQGVLRCSLTEDTASFTACVQAQREGQMQNASFRVEKEGDSPIERKRAATRAAKTAVYRAVLGFLPEPPPWGAMSGVKPAKPLRQAFPQGFTDEEADRLLAERFDIAPSRRRLTIQCARQAMACETALAPNQGALYIGIPFCPSKCVYCSFVSSSTAQSGPLIQPYLEALLGEIRGAGQGLTQSGFTLDSLYIGGGTPTILSAAQLDRLLSAAEQHLPRPLELTVEAGRPDTITQEKLEMLAAHGVGRISVNPQSMQDQVLAQASRPHTADQIVDCYRLVRRTGDFAVNMDLIAGLPGDTEQGFLDSVDQLIALEPENITIHCLARKKGSPLRFGKQGQLPAALLDEAYGKLERAGYAPYYLYRQKYIAGNLENVGFSKPGQICRYNICMMEELCPVVALGAGGVTKLCADGGRSITRLTNPKYPKEYIDHAQTIAQGKAALRLPIKGETTGTVLLPGE